MQIKRKRERKVREQIVKLRKEMESRKIDAYLVMTDDFHGSEYVGDYFKCREYLSGFTGSAGKVVVTADNAVLWTDGRYFIQAQEELKGSGIELYKMGEPGVPDIMEYIKSVLKEGQCLGFDGRTVSAAAELNMEKIFSKNKIKVRYDCDLVGDIWDGRPERSHKKAWILGVGYAGVSRDEKIANLRKILKERSCDAMVITALDEIAWLFNLRGDDVAYNPVLLSYAIVPADEKKDILLFADNRSIDDDAADELNKSGIVVNDYEKIYDYVKSFGSGMKIMMDLARTNSMIYKNIPDGVKIDNVISPVMQSKAVKNATEMNNERKAHLKDGVAVTRLIYYLKHNVGNMDITEIDVVNKIEELRRENESYIEPSFATISAYGTNGAIVHYEPVEESEKKLQPEGFLLIDTGGHYMEGTTDITRTISLGKLSKQQKMHYTAVLKGNLALADTKFLYGCRGSNIDCIARQPLWKMGLDFKHGTGHGVGYILNVHEPPNNISWKINPYQLNSRDAVLEEGMITSDEPGLYLEGEYGIRIENLLMCRKAQKNIYGQFMEFETLTMVPFDRHAIDTDMLNGDERQLLNSYNKAVYENISPYLNEEEREWLKDETKDI